MVRPVNPLTEVSGVLRRFSLVAGFPLRIDPDTGRLSFSAGILLLHALPMALLVGPGVAVRFSYKKCKKKEVDETYHAWRHKNTMPCN